MKFIKTPTEIIPVDEAAPVITQAEYEALSDEEKEKGTYYIIDSNNGLTMAELNDKMERINETIENSIIDKLPEDYLKNAIDKYIDTNNENIATKLYVDNKLYNKVDKIVGKVLSSNDFTDDEKNKLKNIKDDYSDIAKSISLKADGMLYQNNVLYLTSSGNIITTGIKIVSGTGGGGSSGGSTIENNAVLSLKNNNDWISKSLTRNSECMISFIWSSIEDQIQTGAGLLNLYINDKFILSKNIEQGVVKIDIQNYLSSGSNIIKILVSDIYGNTKILNYNVSIIELLLESSFDESIAYDDLIPFLYTPNGDVEKIMHFFIDNKEIYTTEISTSGREVRYNIPKQAHGNHSLLVYFTAIINQEEIKSNELRYDIICVDKGNNTPIISSNFNQTKATQYESINIIYYVYTPNSLNSDIELYCDDKLISKLNVDRTMQYWCYSFESIGNYVLSIVSGNSRKEFNISVIESEINVKAEQNDLILYLSSYGRSNNESNPAKWSYNNVECLFNNFNFTSDGWQLDENNNTVLRITGNARLYVPIKIFENDFRRTGKTIEIEFATHDVLDYNAIIISSMDNNRGIQIDAQQAILKSEQLSINTQYKENEHIRLSFVIQKRSDNRLVECYINAINSTTKQYLQTDDFSQSNPVGLTIGSNDCTVDIYCIRIYDNNLNRYQLLDNWIYDTTDIKLKTDRYIRNNIFDSYGKISIDKLPNYLPYMVLQAPELPQYKGDKKTVSGYYVNKINPDKSFSFTNAQFNVQGTSSQYYPRKNYKASFKEGFIINNQKIDGYKLTDDSIPTSTFTLKADVASSEGANNVELVRLYNEICPYKTPPQKNNGFIRQGIDGYPMIIFWDNGNDINFIGKYNFNNDKGTEEVYGLSDGDESWEMLNNTSERMLWKSDDFSTDDWKNDFEARYPEDNENISNLQILSSWIVSTDREAATNNALQSEITYDGVIYKNDTKEYRLAKFKNELPNYAEVNDLIFYYLFTEIFLMVDSRAKNAFPTKFSNSKWIIFPYDFDTAIGINNEGILAFDYYLEDTDTLDSADVFNGQKSVLWCNLRDVFAEQIKSMYQNLRSKNNISYSIVEKRFEDHQAKWSEAIFNEDAYYKYIQPLIDDNDPSYLSMLQGSKSQHRKWWLYNRFRYLDSKYNAGDALTDCIVLRGYSKMDISIIPYADIYAIVKYGSYYSQVRAFKNNKYILKCELDNVNDTEIMIFSASQLKDVGDLSGLYVGFANFSAATRLQSLKIGDPKSTYSNSNLKELYLGNNTLLRTIDVRNCPKLTQAIDLSGCVNIEEIYFDGTSIVGLSLPNGGIIKTIHLPSTITNLTIKNQMNINDFYINSYSNISTLRIENCNNIVNSKIIDILKSMKSGGRIRLLGFEFDTNETSISELLNIFDSMKGLDEKDNNVPIAQLSGTIHTDKVSGSQLKIFKDKYPDVKIIYNTMINNMYFYDDEDKENLLYVLQLKDDEYGKDPIKNGLIDEPVKESDNYYNYKYSGWNQNVNIKITTDINIYALYNKTDRLYTVKFYNDSFLFDILSVKYNTILNDYTKVPTKTGVEEPNDYLFLGWNPSISNPILKDTNFYATYKCIAYPQIKSSSYYNEANWYNSANNKNTITSIVFEKEYSPNGNEDESWDASEKSNKSVMCYRIGTSIIIAGNGADKIKVINDGAYCMFKGFTSLNNIKSLNLLDTSNATTMNSMFYQCNKLSSLDLSGFNTSKVTSMSSLFYMCSSLSTLNLSNFDTSNVTDMSYMVYGCTSLKSINISIDTQNVKTMYYMFYNCKYLSGLNLSTFNTSNVTTMNSMFYKCSKITTLNLSNFNTSNVVDMGSMFYECQSLTDVTLSSFDTSKVTTMGNMFSNCYDLVSLDISNFDTSNVHNMGSMFYGCLSLKTLMQNFNTLAVTNMYYMFYNCQSLTELNLNNFDITNTLDISCMFGNCKNLVNLYLNKFHTDNVINMGNLFSNCSSLISIDLSIFNTSNTIIMNGMFSNCSSLTSIDLSNFDTSKVTSMGSMFSSCNSIKSINVSSFNTSNVINMNYMFYKCSLLSDLDISNFNISKVTNMNYMMYGCSLLKNIDMSKFVTSSIIYMDNLFYGCSSITSINMKGFNTNNVTSMVGLFRDCTNLSSIDLSNFDTKNVLSMTDMFYNCISLKSALINSFITTNLMTCANMFYNCYNLSYISIRYFDFSKTTNISNMFCNCTRLTSIYLGNFNLQEPINANNIFYNCKLLYTYYLDSKIPQYIPEGIFIINGDKTTIYVPKGSAIEYKSNKYWLNYEKYIKEMDDEVV